MQLPDTNRREFTKWAAAAVGGLFAGLSLGRAVAVAADEPKMKDPKTFAPTAAPGTATSCRGLNPTCTEVKGKKNDCAGQVEKGPTVKEHKCKGMNDCAGEGGCGEMPGENKCKSMGECAVPLSDKAWDKARKNFEAAMKKADKKFGDCAQRSAAISAQTPRFASDPRQLSDFVV